MSYSNYSTTDNSSDVNGGVYNRDPRMSSNTAQYENTQSQLTGYTYGEMPQQFYQPGSDPNYESQCASTTHTSDPNYLYYPSQTNPQHVYHQSTSDYHTQPQAYPTPASQYYDHQQQYYQQPTADALQQYHQQTQYQSYQPEHSTQYPRHYVYDLSFPDEIEQENCLATRSDEELWVEAWLARLGKIQIKLDSTVVINSSKNSLPLANNQPVTKSPQGKQRSATSGSTKVNLPRISDSRSNLSKAFNVLNSIETIYKHLNDNLSTLSSDDWRHSTVQIGALRDELNVLVTPFEGETFIGLKRSVKMRRKKRCCEKRQRLARKDIREKDEENRVKKHEEIDGWLEREKREVQRMQEEEAGKREADVILSDTTRKKLDAKRNLALVHALTKLREVRDKAASGRGEQTSAQDAYAFRNLAERLQDIWANALKEYGKEEHRLRTQLEQTTSEDQRKAKIEREKKVTDDWSQALFGEPLKEGEESGLYLGLTAAERNVDTFIAIRKSWDTFLTKPTDLLASKIPIGWVLPKEHVSDKWSQYLQLNTSCNIFTTCE